MPRLIGRMAPDEQHPSDRPWNVYVVEPDEFGLYGIPRDDDTPRLYRGFVTTPDALYGGGGSRLRVELGAELASGFTSLCKVQPVCLCRRFAGAEWLPNPCCWCDGSGFVETMIPLAPLVSEARG